MRAERLLALFQAHGYGCLAVVTACNGYRAVTCMVLQRRDATGKYGGEQEQDQLHAVIRSKSRFAPPVYTRSPRSRPHHPTQRLAGMRAARGRLQPGSGRRPRLGRSLFPCTQHIISALTAQRQTRNLAPAASLLRHENRVTNTKPKLCPSRCLRPLVRVFIASSGAGFCLFTPCS